MDCNFVALGGRLVARPDVDDGGRVLSLLVTVRSDQPTSRIDVIRVAVEEPEPHLAALPPGTRLWIAGSLRRRFRHGSVCRTSRIEVAASAVSSFESIAGLSGLRWTPGSSV